MASVIKVNLRLVKSQVETTIERPISCTEMSKYTKLSRTRISQILNSPTTNISLDTVSKLVDFFYNELKLSGKNTEYTKTDILKNLLSITD